MSAVPDVNSEELRKHVVRVEAIDGRVLGTGFFVAPGWVLTCAHVVADLDTLRLSPAGGGEPFEAIVRGRSPSPPRDWVSAIWPFPDLALLHFPAARRFPCVLLAMEEPNQDHDCVAWGYARREEGVAPVGAAAALRFQGVDGDGYLSLRRGLVHPGLSGAPLVCPKRRAVVGVVADTRDPRGDLGGWASPVSALGVGEPVLPPDLVTAAAEVLRLNRAAVLRDRTSWHAVLPLSEAGAAVETTWVPFVRGKKSVPSQMLVAEHLVVPFLFRDQDLDQVQAWCEAPEPMALTVVPGRGGSGKTRFAIEICRRMQGQGWVAGFLRDESVATVPLPRLVVVDYAEAVPNLAEVLKLLRSTATDIAPVRVLLLTRTSAASAADPLKLLRREAVLQQIVDDSEDAAAAASALTVPQRRTLHAESMVSFSRAWGLPDISRDRGEYPTKYGAPLEILVDALNAVLGGE